MSTVEHTANEAERVYHGPVDVSPERQARWTRWVEDYAIGAASAWVQNGESEDAAIGALDAVLGDWAQLDSLPWTPLGTAQATRLSVELYGGTELHGAERVEYMAALRTCVVATEHELLLATSYHLGVTVPQARNLRDAARRNLQLDDDSEGTTALYRYYDRDDVLLYVGITKNAATRDEQHARKSAWHPLNARRDLEWFDTRDEAHAAERQAIRKEEPLFNATHANEATKGRAIAYLLAAVTKVGAA